MRFAGLLLVVAIIGYVWSRRGGRTDAASEIDELMATPPPAVASAGATPAHSQPQPASSGLRKPIDHTRGVLEQVKARNGNGEF
jgi:hypothetical protein